MRYHIAVIHTPEAIEVFARLRVIPRFVAWFDLPFIFDGMSQALTPEKYEEIKNALDTAKVTYQASWRAGV